MQLEQYKNMYFIGIGGIGMSALARYFHHMGKKVAGYDRISTSLTDLLQNEGMHVHFKDNFELIPGEFKNPSNTLIIYTPAIPSEHNELIYFKNNHFYIYKRSEILGLITRDKFGIAIAGTHGKTSISTMLSHILFQTNEKCNAFLGGISKNYNSNFIFSEISNRVVIEADEFDRSFLQLTPKFALITSMDADHLDIYGTHEELIKTYNQFISQIKNNGILVHNKKIYKNIYSKAKINRYTYSLDTPADFYGTNLRINKGSYIFDLDTPFKEIKDIELQLPGKLNIENAIGAISLSLLLGVDEEKIKVALKTFKGVQRRFDYQINTPELVFIDDYAHHPEEISSTILSVKDIYPNKKITGIFQPHLFSRTRDFVDGFAQSLDLLDEVILLDIYPAREEPIAGITSEIIYSRIKNKNKIICRKNDLLKVLQNKDFEVVLTLGAGDIDQLILPIKNQLMQKTSIN